METCTVETCAKPIKVKSAALCGAHYQKAWKHGDPNYTPPRKSNDEMFWAMVDKSGECWEWRGFRNEKGYGKFTYGYAGAKTTHRAHRLAWELSIGPIPEGMHLDHVCHNKGCVNPDHLRICTNKQNQENRAGAQSTSRTGVRGVFPGNSDGKYYGRVKHNRTNYYVGTFDTIAEAEAAVIAKRLELFSHNDIDRQVAA